MNTSLAPYFKILSVIRLNTLISSSDRACFLLIIHPEKIKVVI